MKIPTPDFGQVRTRPIGLAQESHNYDTGTGALIRGIGAVGGAVETAQALNDKRAAAAKEKADAAAVDALYAQAQEATTKGLHGYDEAPKPRPGADPSNLTIEDLETAGGPGEHIPGFLDTRGHEAYQRAGDFTTSLQKTYDKLLAQAGNEEQRAALTKGLTRLKLSVQGQVAEHEGKQLKVAELAASKSLLDSTLRQATALYNKQDELKPFVDDALASIKRTSMPEEYEARARDFLADVATERIGAYLAKGDLKGAEAQLKTDAETLGGKVAGRLQEHLDVKKRAAQQQADELSAQALASRVADAERNVYGFLDEGKENALREAVDGVYPEQKEAMQAVVERAIALEDRRRDATIKGWTQEAKTLRLRGGTAAIYPELRKKLEIYNPDYLDAVKRDDRQRWEHAEAKRTGGAAAKAAASKQKELNRLALKRMKTLPLAEQAEYEQRRGLEGQGLDEEGRLDLQVQQRKARDWVAKGFDKAKEKLDADVDEQLKGKALAKEDPDARFNIKADAAEQLEAFVEKNGRAPDAAERAKLVSDVALKQATKPRSFIGIPMAPTPEFPYQRERREGKPSTLKPGRYVDKQGRVVIVGPDGKKRLE